MLRKQRRNRLARSDVAAGEEEGEVQSDLPLDGRKKKSDFFFSSFRHLSSSLPRARRLFAASLFIIISCLGIHYFTIRCPGPSHYDLSVLQEIAQTSSLVVSLGTVDSRQEELVQTVRSILRQTVPPAQIQIHYSALFKENEYPVQSVRKRLEELLVGATKERTKKAAALPSIDLFPAQSRWRSAAKLLGALNQQQHNNTSGNNLIVVADDDFVYSPRWLESLLVGHLNIPDAAVALRGWRVHSDLIWGARGVGSHAHPDGVWGSFPATERYVIRGSNLCQAYRVGVVTGVHGILYRRAMFGSEIFDAPDPLYTSMDDIWASGHLANRSIARFVVPMVGRDTAGLHLGTHKSVIDPQNRRVSRGQANNQVLHYYKEAWEKDNLYWTEDDSPVLAGFLPLRHWLSEHVIIGLHSVGWIRRAVGAWNRLDDE